MAKIYLGDSVYAELESGMIKLTTENGGPPDNIIWLEPEVVGALLSFIGIVKEGRANDRA